MCTIGAVLVICIAVLGSEATVYGKKEKKCICLTAPLQGSVEVRYRHVSKTTAVATYSCRRGYYIEGSVTRHCVRGVWQGNNPSCQRTECPLLSQRAGGAVAKVLQLRKSSGWIEYKCNKGYNLVGDSTSFCVKGQWTGRKPNCTAQADSQQRCLKGQWTCNFPEAPVFSIGPVLATCKKKLQKATYKCDHGYKMIGQKTLACRRGEVKGTPPFCQLDVFSEDRVCNFSRTSHNCHNGTAVLRQRTVPKKQQMKMTGVALRPLALPVSMTQFLDTIDMDFPDVPVGGAHRARSSVPVRKSCSPTSITVLQLDLPMETTTGTRRREKRQTKSGLGPGLLTRVARMADTRVRAGKATFEVGPLSNEVARYVKFSLEAPMGALSYSVVVAGHCLPDPPGDLHIVHLIRPVSSLESVSRDFCLNLHERVKCNTAASGSFHFSLRLTIFFRYSGESPSTIRFISKGAFQNFPGHVCPGRKAENE